MQIKIILVLKYFKIHVTNMPIDKLVRKVCLARIRRLNRGGSRSSQLLVNPFDVRLGNLTIVVGGVSSCRQIVPKKLGLLYSAIISCRYYECISND